MNVDRKYDPRKPLIEELERNSNELFLLLNEIIEKDEYLKRQTEKSMKDIQSLINHIRISPDKDIDIMVKKALDKRGLSF